LGLSYFWTGAQNGVELQVWATWIVYAVLLDLTEAVAKALHQPLRAISVEMVYRGLYHFGQAYGRGEADDPIAYLVRHAKLLGILKQGGHPKAAPPTSTAADEETKPKEEKFGTAHAGHSARPPEATADASAG
jgi:hypothetical protein